MDIVGNELLSKTRHSRVPCVSAPHSSLLPLDEEQQLVVVLLLRSHALSQLASLDHWTAKVTTAAAWSVLQRKQHDSGRGFVCSECRMVVLRKSKQIGLQMCRGPSERHWGIHGLDNVSAPLVPPESLLQALQPCSPLHF